jgi:hypothetical protein
VIATLRNAGFSVDPMEDWTAASAQPKEFSQERIKDCDLCVLLVGFRRGHIPKGRKLSITQLEYQAAIKSNIDVLVFMLDEGSSWPSEFDERTKDPKLRHWRAQLKERHGVKFFGPDPESVEIAPDLTRWVLQKRMSAESSGARRERVALLRWIEGIPDEFDRHFKMLWSFGFAKDKITPDQKFQVDASARELTDRCAQIVEQLPDKLAEVNISEQKKACYEEVFPAFKRETDACFDASQKLTHPFEAAGMDGSKVRIPFSMMYQALEVSEHLHILRLCAEQLVLMFPINEVEEARQASVQSAKTGS